MPEFRKKDNFRRLLLREPFPEEWGAWLSTNIALYPLLSSTEQSRLRDDARIMMAEKTWEGCDGLKVTDTMKITVAAQAALLILGIEHDYFMSVLSIVLFPTKFESPARSGQERGGVFLGCADYGAVFLSLETVLAESRDASCGHNLVIHEFSHQFDFLDGHTHGVPALLGRDQARRWQRVMQGTYLFNGLRVRRVIAECDSRNFASRRLLLKSGLRQESECIQDHQLKGEWVDKH